MRAAACSERGPEQQFCVEYQGKSPDLRRRLGAAPALQTGLRRNPNLGLNCDMSKIDCTYQSPRPDTSLFTTSSSPTPRLHSPWYSVPSVEPRAKVNSVRSAGRAWLVQGRPGLCVPILRPSAKLPAGVRPGDTRLPLISVEWLFRLARVRRLAVRRARVGQAQCVDSNVLSWEGWNTFLAHKILSAPDDMFAQLGAVPRGLNLQLPWPLVRSDFPKYAYPDAAAREMQFQQGTRNLAGAALGGGGAAQ
ncbi:hypothetical protein C8R46DRAFT_1293995 [Mycena filopes]|nr:hypothetical protein C8R46DRAFT_1293995 [Mycena filopes]